MRRNLILVPMLGLLLALFGSLASDGISQNAYAREDCSDHSLRGGYGHAFEGQVFASGSEVAEIAGSGRVVFDGHGGLSGRESASTNGVPSELTFTGSYSVQSDCTGTATFVNDNGRTDHGKIMLVEGGQEVNFIDTDPGVVLAIHFSKQSIQGCTNRSLRGVYGFAESGSLYAPNGSEIGDLAALARINFDGQGHASGSETTSFNGAPGSDTFVGTYSVKPDCTGSATSVHSNGLTDHVNFVLVKKGSAIKFIVTDPGVVFAGTVDQQPDQG